ncbi:MAG: bacterioferritin [Hyphomicrobiaceae bacterium]|nr:bacterioferritin [Hyphomicrobiaceae bacterium]
MSSKKKVAENLQKGLSKELAAINQYFLHALVAEDWGLNKLAVRMREEMGHAERFARRLVFLGENPEVMPEKPPHRAQELQDMFESDLRDEEDAIKFYTKASRDADAADDIGSRDIFENITLEEEGHKQWLELQLSLLRRMGEPNYIAMHMGEPAEEGE